MALHCSHIHSRRHKTIRWCVENAQALCAGCHAWFGYNPDDSHDWIVATLGNDGMDNLRDKRNSLQKVSKLDEKDIASHYRKEYKAIKKKRDGGEIGYIKFESFQ